MNDDTVLGGVLGQLGQTVKKVGQQVVKIPAVSAEGSGPLRQSSSEPQWQSDEERVKFLRDLYGPSEKNPSPDVVDKSASFAKAASSAEVATKAESAAKPDEQKKLMELRNQLHKENYYDPTFNPVKKQEERASEKVENEKKQEMQDLQQKEEKKPPPLAVVREQNKAEMFRGASG